MYSYVFILLTFSAFGNAYPSFFQTNEPVQRITIADCFDHLLSKLPPIIKNFGLDPMKFPNINQEIPGVFALNLTDGVISGASNLLQKGECAVTFYRSHWRFHLNIHPGKLECKSDYSFVSKMFITQYEGILNASIENATVGISVDLELLTFTLHNPKIHIDDVGNFVVGVGENIIEKVFQQLVQTLQDVIKFFAESTATDAAENAFNIQNQNVNATISSVFENIVPILSKLYIGDAASRLDVYCLLTRYAKMVPFELNTSVSHYTELLGKLLTKDFWKQLMSDLQENGEACLRNVGGEFERRNRKL